MAARWFSIVAVLSLLVPQTWALEPLRTFKTASGQAFQGRLVSYEGQTFYIQGKDSKFYPVPFKQLSAEDQKYLIQVAQLGKVPKGDPRSIAKETPSPTPSVEETPKDSGSPNEGVVLRPAPKPKPKLRPGSFFAYKPINLGQDPSLASAAKEVSAIPGPDEPIDFTNHVLPILEDRCFSCHNAPYEKNGRTTHPKAGLRLDTYEWVMKGNLDNTVVEAGNLEDSYLYEVITMDEEDDMFMPPKGGALSPEQIDVIKRWILEGAKPSAGGAGIASDMSNGISFHDHIFPLIEERCLDCHSEPYVKNGRTIHPKAGLRLDTYESIIKGNLDGTIIEKGNAEESTLFAVITLDSDDPEIMPPKGAPLTEDEINMFKQWITEGAKENPSDTFVQPKEVEAEVVTDAANSNLSLIDTLAKRLKAPSRPQMEAAQKSGALVTLLSARHSMVRAEFSSGPNLIKDDAIGALSGIKNNVSHLDLSRTSVTDGVLGEVKKFNNLTWLNLKDTSVTDRGIQNISKMPYLTYLNLVSSKISDKSVETLASIKTLQEVYLWNSDVTENGIKRLRSALPDAKILF
ncbi:hypothetical protein N9N13_07050 [Opitutales bacterium]|jgi:hypothetical protein|nr:hypothetical protein [Opitutales bacterium]